MTVHLPIFPLRAVLFPGDLMPLHVFEPRYRLMLSRCAGSDPAFGVVLTRSGGEVGDEAEIHETGTAARILEQVVLPDGRSNMLVRGTQRFRVLASDWNQSYMMATVEWCDAPGTSGASAELIDSVGEIRNLLNCYLSAYSQATGQPARFRDFGDDPVAFAWAVATTLPMPLESRQRVLEATPPHELLAVLAETVRHETALLIKTGAYAFLPGNPGARFSRN
ncbi:MAG: LON peptidase substrate-binding domain-containing protein [Thermomicrobiales bacterium]